MKRRTFLSGFAASTLSIWNGAARAQADADGVTRIITGSPAGTPGDVLGRALAGPLGAQLGRTVIV